MKCQFHFYESLYYFFNRRDLILFDTTINRILLTKKLSNLPQFTNWKWSNGLFICGCID